MVTGKGQGETEESEVKETELGWHGGRQGTDRVVAGEVVQWSLSVNWQVHHSAWSDVAEPSRIPQVCVNG